VKHGVCDAASTPRGLPRQLEGRDEAVTDGAVAEGAQVNVAGTPGRRLARPSREHSAREVTMTWEMCGRTWLNSGPVTVRAKARNPSVHTGRKRVEAIQYRGHACFYLTSVEGEAVVGSGCGAGSDMLFHDEAL
jgi:hypothetical protein